ncbi:MAG: HlyD family efflux transporter periplasmic adaptor subunit [Lachnospiraceae bacterium]|nr:HlyD family efflux transporter periplasmic adaptor subunit [Lachnospiraceae bacterium]
MSKAKKIIIGLIVTLVVAGITVTVLHFLKKKNADSKTIDVYAVNEIGQDGSWFGSNSTIAGYVSINMEQKIYPISSQKIKEIHVKEGDTVKVGDVIIEYDVTSQNLALETKRTEVELARTSVLAAQRELEELKKITPIEDMPQPEPEPTTEEPTTENPTTENPTTEEPTIEEPTTETPITEEPTTENPNPDIPISTDTDADMEENEKDEAENIPIGDNLESEQASAPDAQVIPNSEDNNPDIDSFDEGEVEETYTREELNKAIADKQSEINSLNTAYQLEQIEYEIMEYQLSSGQVTANFDGVVKTVLDEEEALSNNTAMIVISGNSGYTVEASIGELSLDKVNLGETVSLYCYDTGMNYTGTISDISLMPTTNGYSYSEKMETFYPVSITIEDAEDLERGMYMEITLPDDNTNTSGSLYLSMAFVMRDNDNFYVMKEDNGKLKKVYVETGKIMWGELIEIKRGVSYNDYLAFPYASGVEEGIKTNHARTDSLYY